MIQMEPLRNPNPAATPLQHKAYLAIKMARNMRKYECVYGYQYIVSNMINAVGVSLEEYKSKKGA